jgi:dUTP pyrophosphatase
MVTIPTKLLTMNAKLPTYGSETAAGMDLYYDSTYASGSYYVLLPGERKLFKVGISVEIPEGMYGRIAPRSGMAYKHGIDVMAGVIDSDYRGEIGVILINHGDANYTVSDGERIAQMILTPHFSGNVVAVDALGETDRGGGKYGSTGK